MTGKAVSQNSVKHGRWMRFEYRAKPLIRKDMKKRIKELDRLIEEAIFENGCRRHLKTLEAAIRSEEE